MNCEIEFLPVGDGCKPGDAIVVRYGEPNAWELMVIDGGNLECGKAVVRHVKSAFGEDAVVAHALVTHSDADHASGMREVLAGLPVSNLWVHMPWSFAAQVRPFLANKSWTDQGLAQELHREYDIIGKLVDIATENGTTVGQAFAGIDIGPFKIISPYRNIYPALVAQFDRTPDADRAVLEQAGLWIGKPLGLVAKIVDKVAAKVQKWTTETWEKELLKDGGITSASNESSVVLYGDFGIGRRVLLTADAGIWGLTMANHFAQNNGLTLQNFTFVQIPHHGSRRNVGPTILNTLLGPSLAKGTVPNSTAFVSAPKEDDTHPRKMVLNAFIRRGFEVSATQGKKIVHWGGFPPRPGYGPLQGFPFSSQVEDYD